MARKNMAVKKIFPLLLLLEALSVNAGTRNERQEASRKTSFDEILKPPPPPFSPWVGGQRHQRQNNFAHLPTNFQMPAPFSRPSNYGPPFPNHNQFRYGPPAPAPFFTTQSPPSIFQKVSKWLFPPAAPTETSISSSPITNVGASLKTTKKDCNPCNLVPWLPVLRYQVPPPSNLGPLQNLIGNTAPGHPTYGPPPSNQQDNSQNIGPPFVPPLSQNYNTLSGPSQNLNFPKLSYPTGFKNSYGEPITSKYPTYQVSSSGAETSKLNALPDASEYRPSIYKPVYLNNNFPQFTGSNSLISGSHNQLTFSSPNSNQQNHNSNTLTASLGNNINFLGGAPFTVSNSNNKNQQPISHSLTPPNANNENQQQTDNSFTASNFNHQNQASTILTSPNNYDQNQNTSPKPSSQIEYHVSSFSSPNSNIQTQYQGSSLTSTSTNNNNQPLTNNASSPNSNNKHSASSSYTSTNTNFQTSQQENNLQSLSTVNNVNQQQASSSFTSQSIHNHDQQSVSNSIVSPGLTQYDLQNSPYYTNVTSNAPNINHHSNHRGRGIHTLQPVPLPNLSVSPLPPIFNAKPFISSNPYVDQAYPPQDPSPIIVDDLFNHNSNSNIQIIPSIPVAEFTSSVDYPITIIQSPVLDIDQVNQTNNYASSDVNLEQTAKDAASQASESYTASASSIRQTENQGNQNEQFVGNHKHFLPNDKSTVQSANIPPNHRPSFADLRGILSTGVDDAFGSEQNLQAIDSPILYLKPNTPHKEFERFSTSTLPTTIAEEYPEYDEVPTSITPPLPTATDNWVTFKYTDLSETSSPRPTVPVTVEPQEPSTKKPKVLQIIIPYTSNVNPSPFKLPIPIGIDTWSSTKLEDAEHVGRRVPQINEPYDITSQNTVQREDPYISTTLPTTESFEHVTEFYDSLRINTNQNSDIYDVKEPPFDMLALQHNIDGWTEQEFAKHYQAPQQVNVNGNFAKAKKIPDEYFTTPHPLQSYPSTVNEINAPFFDHEFASSIRHSNEQNLHNVTVIANIDNTLYESNLIVPSTDRTPKSRKEGKQKPFIYTAASSFRSLSTTVAPWEQIQTSISPLTKEKVYVVTAQPWRESNGSKEDDVESTRNKVDGGNDTSVSGSNINAIFKSPRFAVRPSPAPIANSASSEENFDYKFGYKWHVNINDLEDTSSTVDFTRRPSASTTEGASHLLQSSTHEDPSATTQASVQTLEGAQRRNSTES